MRDRREAVARQLLPATKPLSRVRVVIVGNSGVGKTTLVESLKCGFIRSLFRRSGAAALSTNSRDSGDGTVLLDGLHIIKSIVTTLSNKKADDEL